MSLKNREDYVISMEFDNKNFESGVRSTLSALDKLKMGVDGLVAGAEGLKFQFQSSSIGQFVSSIGQMAQFSVVNTVISEATRSLMNFNSEIRQTMLSMSDFTQAKAGWSKYEEETTSVKTIMSATGKDIDYVQERLDKLMWFTDETSYNFTDMTSNIGKFTAQGVDLDVAVTAMEGIATWAALSGQNAASASRAMYNLSQAIGVGAVKLMDWKSIENANMATKEFKEQAIQTAIAMGTLVEENGQYYSAVNRTASSMAVTSENFSQTLSDGWFTSDVLTTVLSKYGEYADLVQRSQKDGELAAQTMERIGDAGMELGYKAFIAAQEAKTLTDVIDATKDAVSTKWLKTWELIFGNYEEAKGFWTDLCEIFYDLFAAMGDVRIEVLEMWRGLGGRNFLLDSFYDLWELISGDQGIFTMLKKGMLSVLDYDPIEKIASNLAMFSARLSSFVKNTKKTLTAIGGTWWDSFDRIGKGFGNIIQIFTDAFDEFNKVFSISNLSIDGVAGVINKIADSFYQATKKLREFCEENDIFKRTFVGLKPVIEGVIKVIKSLFGLMKDIWDFINATGIKDGFAMIFATISSNVKIVIDSLKQAFDSIGANEDKVQLFTSFGEAVSKVFEILAWTLNKIANIISNLLGSITKVINKIISVASMVVTVVKDHIAEVFDEFKNRDKDLRETTTLFDLLSKALDKLDNPKVADSLNKILDIFGKVVSSGLIITITTYVMILVKKLFDLPSAILGIVKKAEEAVEGLKGVFKSISSLFNSLEKNLRIQSVTSIVLKFAFATAILSAALIALSYVPFEKLAAGTAVIGGLITGLTAAMKQLMPYFTEIDPSKIAALSIALIAFGAAIYIMSSGISKIVTALSKLDGGVFEQVMAILSSAGSLAGGIMLMVAIIEVFAKMAETMSVSQINQIMKIGIAMVIMAESVYIMSKAIAKLAKLPVDDMWRAAGAVTGVLTALMLVAIALDNFTNGNANDVLKIGGAMLLMGTSLKTIAKAMRIIGTIDGDKLGGVLASMAMVMAGLTVMAATLAKVNTSFGDLLGISGMMMSFATSMVVLSAACKIIATIEWEDLKKGGAVFGALVIALVGLMAATKLVSGGGALAGLAGVLMSMGAAVIFIAGAFKILGSMDTNQITAAGIAIGSVLVVLVGLAAASSAFPQLAGALTTVAGALALVGVGALAFGAGVALIGVGLSFVVGAVVTLATAIKDLIASITEDDINHFFDLLSTVGERLPAALDTLGDIIWGRLEAMVQRREQMVELLGTVISVVLDVLTALWPKIEDFLILSIKGLLKIADVTIPILNDVIYNNLESLLNMIADKLIPKVNDTIEANLKDLADAIDHVIEYIVESIVRNIMLVTNKASQLIIDIATVISETILKVLTILKETTQDIVKISVETGLAVIVGILEGLASGVQDIIDAAWNLAIDVLNGLADGFEDNEQDLIDATNRLFEDVIKFAVDTFKNNKDEFLKMGGYIIDGLTEGLIGDGPLAKIGNAMKGLADKVVNVFTSKEDGLDIHSPSKLFQKFGNYTVDGFVQGVKDKVQNAKDGMKDLAKTGLDAFKESMMNQVGGMLDTTDLTPTITPVLDLDSFSSGIGDMNSLMASSSDFSIGGNYSGITGIQSQQQLNGQMLTDMMSSLGAEMANSNAAISTMAQQSQPINVNVELEGDTKKIFKVVRKENYSFLRKNGYSPLA